VLPGPNVELGDLSGEDEAVGLVFRAQLNQARKKPVP